MRYITDACQTMIPEVLTEYLLRLAEESDCPKQGFVLSIRKIGIGKVQDILVLRENDSFCRRVFGCPPVDAELTVVRRGENIYMSLYGDEKPFGEGAPVCSA
ncbi:MAG: hypothetical protein GXY01_07630 [Clostridiales bacterium]|nr:hypothetical protein [Clostridiales bacterium]